MRLLSSSSANTKTRKSERPDYRIVSLALSHAATAPGFPSNCPKSTKSCENSCVGGVGLASVWKSISEARQKKTAFLRQDRSGFLKQLYEELAREQERADEEGATLCARLNCYSDLPWFMPSFGSIPDKFPRMVLWDYSKVKSYCFDAPRNYIFTFSRTELNEDDCIEVIEHGTNVAVVFGEPGAGFTGPRAYSQRIPRTYRFADGKQRLTYDADSTDLRFLDFKAGQGNQARYGRIAALRLKASNNDAHQASLASGFAVTVER